MPRMTPQRCLLAVAVAGLAMLTAACAPRNQALRIKTQWVGYESLCLAEDLGKLPPGVTLQHGARAADTLAALRAGTVEAGTLTLDEMLDARAAGTPLTEVLIFDSSSGADVLLAWRDDRVDAVVSHEPTAAQLQAEGAQRLFDSRQMPDTIFDVLAMRTDRLAGREAALRKAIETHFEMHAYINQNRDDAVYRIAAHQGVTAADVRRAMAGVTVPDVGGNRYALHDGSRFDAAARRVHRLMTGRGMLGQQSSLDGLFSADFLPLPRLTAP